MRWLKWIIIAVVAIVVAVLVLWPPPAYPQQDLCGPMDVAAKMLEKKYGEEMFAVGMMSNEFQLRLYANRKTRTWTAFSVGPNGMSCVIGSGSDLDFVAPPKPGEPA